jgi:hypothetical protein
VILTRFSLTKILFLYNSYKNEEYDVLMISNYKTLFYLYERNSLSNTKITMTIFNKIKWILGVSMIFALILTTNLIDRNNFVKVRDSVVAIYKDRLIADNLIFKISNSIHEKETAIAYSDTLFYSERNNEINTDIQGYIKRFEETKLTIKENKIFKEFKNNFESLKATEVAFVESGFQTSSNQLNHIYNIKDNLQGLAIIQLDEGGRQVAISKKAISTVELFTQIEIYVLVIMAVFIQIVIMYRPKEK